MKEKWDDDGNGVKWRDSRQRGGLLRPETRLPRENTRSNRATSDDAPRTEGAFLIELACISSLAGYYPRYLADRVTWRHNRRSSSNVTRIFERRINVTFDVTFRPFAQTCQGRVFPPFPFLLRRGKADSSSSSFFEMVSDRFFSTEFETNYYGSVNNR